MIRKTTSRSSSLFRLFLAPVFASVMILAILLLAGLGETAPSRAKGLGHPATSSLVPTDSGSAIAYNETSTTTRQTEIGSPDSSETISANQGSGQNLSPDVIANAGTVLGVFANSWSYSSLGLVYIPDENLVRYAHESQDRNHYPTIYDITIPDHAVDWSIAPSAVNSDWPWQIDNRDGAGYDPVAHTTFLPDYNGDQSYADDNIIEIDTSGKILNAWEMDKEVGSNDSADGSKINSITDIAVVPGDPNRYFVAAAYDGRIVYEIVLTRTGVWWSPKSWCTVRKFTIPIKMGDNLGIDYDSQNQVLYHSSWDNTKIVVTELDMSYLASFDCPGAGGYNSGVTFIEGSSPSEIWVTDFDSDMTTRCEAWSRPLPDASWTKTINGIDWSEGMIFTSQTSSLIQVVDTITAGLAFNLSDEWDPAHLYLKKVTVDPPQISLITSTGSLIVTGDDTTPDEVTVTKQFVVQPSTWTHTIVDESLTVAETIFDPRPFTVTKLAPQLGLVSKYETAEVLAANVATLTLSYSNDGGYENDVLIRNEFPVSAPLVYADPEPDREATDGSWAEWDVGNMAKNASGSIDAYVYISPTLATSTSLEIWGGIYNHLGDLADEAVTTLHVNGSAQFGWSKFVDGSAWSPRLSVTKEMSDTFEIVDVISVTQAFNLTDVWDPSHLSIEDWSVEPGSYVPTVESGLLSLNVLVPTQPITLTKIMALEPCTWTQTLLWEQVTLSGLPPTIMYMPVSVYKVPSVLELAGNTSTPDVYAGHSASYTLNYGNSGGAENVVYVRAELPSGVTFMSSNPTPYSGGSGDSVITWRYPNGLTSGQNGSINVTVRLADDIPPETDAAIKNTILDHAESEQDAAIVTFRTRPPVWQKSIDGQTWTTDLQTDVGADKVITVIDTVTGDSGFSLVDRWPSDQLTLVDAQSAKGSIVSASGRMTWTVSTAAAGQATITRRFQVQTFTKTYSVLWEDIRPGGAEWERRAVTLDNLGADLRIQKKVVPQTAYPGSRIAYTLAYSNAGYGAADGVVITDRIPAGLMDITYSSSGVVVTQTSIAPNCSWQVSNLATGDGGFITISGTLSPTLEKGILVNTTGITTTTSRDSDPSNNFASVDLTVGENVRFLPIILKQDTSQ